MGPLLPLILAASAAARAATVLPEAVLEPLRAPFSRGEALPVSPPEGAVLGYEQNLALISLRARLEALRERRPPADAAAFEGFLAAYHDEIEAASRDLRLSEPQRARAKRTYLERLRREGLPPEARRLLEGFMNPSQDDAAARRRAQALLLRRAVGPGPRLGGRENAFGSASAPEGLESPGGVAAAGAAGRGARAGAEGPLRAGDFRPRPSVGPGPGAPPALTLAAPSPSLLSSARAMLDSTLQTLSHAMPHNHGLRVMDEAARRYPDMASGNTEQDAWRHARWHQRMVTDPCGSSGAWCKAPMSAVAVAIGTAHELAGAVSGQPWAEFKMDMSNNWSGMLAAWRGSGPDEIDALMQEGRLVVLEPSGGKK